MTKCYSVNGESFEDSLVDVLTEMAGNGDLKEGASYYEADQYPITIDEIFHVDNLLEDLQCNAEDLAGEAAEDFTNIPVEKIDELDMLIKTWIKENMTIAFYGVRNIREVTVTHNIIDEYCDC